jgi:threonine dehydrogenase-like Zn-dependent dehydrogenase
MKAAQAIARGRVECVDAPMPACRPGDLLIKTDMASICGSDLHMVGLGWAINAWPAPPGHPGHEAVGTVVESPSKNFKEGDRVLTVPHIWRSMCFAEYQAVDEPHILKLPANADVPQVLMAQQLGTVIFASKRLPPLVGKTCLVLGQGSAGLFWDFMLRRLGAKRVIAVEPVTHRRALGRMFGATDAVDVTGERAVQAVMDLTGGQGADVVVEAVGSTPTLSQAFHFVRDEGLVVLFGLPESVEPVPFDYTTFFRKRANAFTVLGAQDEPGLKSFAAAVDLITSGQIDVRPVVSHRLPVSEVTEAFLMASHREHGVVKVGLTF